MWLVGDTPLNYNILLGRLFMYVMKVVSSSVFRTMMFALEGKVVTIDQLTYHDSHPSTNLQNIL